MDSCSFVTIVLENVSELRMVENGSGMQVHGSTGKGKSHKFVFLFAISTSV